MEDLQINSRSVVGCKFLGVNFILKSQGCVNLILPEGKKSEEESKLLQLKKQEGESPRITVFVTHGVELVHRI